LRGALRVTARVMNAAGTALILVLMVLVNADVLGRGLFNRPISGVNEFAAQCLVAIVFLQLVDATAAGRLTRSDAIIEAAGRRRPRSARLVEAVFDACGVALFVALLAGTWPLLATAWVDGDYVGVVGIVTFPTWPVRAIIVLAALLMALHFAGSAWRNLAAASGRGTSPA